MVTPDREGIPTPRVPYPPAVLRLSFEMVVGSTLTPFTRGAHWSKFDEMHGLTDMVSQVDEELSDYSASAREDLERFILIGGLALGLLAVCD